MPASERAGGGAWRAAYVRQREHKKSQLDEMMRYAESHGCRMLDVMRHFGDPEARGDREGQGQPCGGCDVCAPRDCLVRRYRPPRAQEVDVIRRIGAALRRRDGQGAAQLHRESGSEALVDRHGFERLLGGLARAGLVQVTRDTFEKDGRTIAFQRVALTRAGRLSGFDDLRGVAITEEAPARAAARGKRGHRGRAARGRAAASVAPEAPQALVSALQAWRLAEARRQRVPAFRILTDRALTALAQTRPTSAAELLAVPGLGPRLVARYGEPLLRLVGATG